MREKILCVDDDANILAGYKRQLRKRFHLETAGGGEEALEVMAKEGPFAVVVSDMRMPGMDGIQFLTETRERSPDTVRLMLTGNADLQTAIDAVNEGSIFRFLTKPCSSETLAAALNAGLEQYRLVMAEKVLLRDTLTGSVKVLMDIVALVNPAAFGRASRIRRTVKHIAQQLGLDNLWEFELAGMLSQIGCVALPPSVLQKLCDFGVLAPEEQELFGTHPQVGQKLLENIPRLKGISEMIGRQREPYSLAANEERESTDAPGSVDLGAQILKVAVDLDEQMASGMSFQKAWRKMMTRSGMYNPDVLDALMTLQTDKSEEERVMSTTVEALGAGMVAAQDICSHDGLVLVPKGQEITYPVLALLRNAGARKGVVEPFMVQVGGWIAGQVTEDAGEESSDEPVTATTEG